VVADGETLAAGQIHWPLTLTCSLSCDSRAGGMAHHPPWHGSGLGQRDIPGMR
jgi:hypothetical protein